jgi:hypothetical protein
MLFDAQNWPEWREALDGHDACKMGLQSETIARNLTFETMLMTAKERPTNIAAVSNMSFILSDTSPTSMRKAYYNRRAARTAARTPRRIHSNALK